jgi:hypothetical protein
MKFWGLFKIENLVINSLKRKRDASAIRGCQRPLQSQEEKEKENITCVEALLRIGR